MMEIASNVNNEKKGNICCSVFGCGSIQKRNPNVSFHSFPQAGKSTVLLTNRFGLNEECDRLRAWKIKLKIGKQVTKYMKVCSLHFKKEDYVTLRCFSNRILSKEAVPSLNLPNLHTIVGTKRKSRVQKRRENREIYNKNCNICVQVNTRQLLTISDIIKTSSQLKILTGLPSFSLLIKLTNLFNIVDDDDENKDIHLSYKLNNPLKRLLLTLIKIKHNLPYVVLAVLFNVNLETCKRIFFETVPKLSEIFRSVISLPTTLNGLNKVQKTQEEENVRIVLDCTEICIKGSKETLKFLTGVSSDADGIITFVSPVYNGRMSHKTITEKSGLLDKQVNLLVDHILVDKGFLIGKLDENICGIKIVNPQFLKRKEKIVVIERVNQQIKTFKILSNKIEIDLIFIINDLVVIACGIINVTNPMLKDKFK